MHHCDRICHLCKERKNIFSFQSVWIREVSSSIYVCHECTIALQKKAIYANGIDDVNPLSTPQGNWNT